MTMAGANCRGSIWRWTYTTDDSVGGADPTGTFVYTDVYCRFQAQPTEQLLLQQGLETQRTFTANVYPGWLDIHESDEFEVTAPTDAVYYAKRFRILSVSFSDHNRRDPRQYIMLNMVRSVKAHEHQ